MVVHRQILVRQLLDVDHTHQHVFKDQAIVRGEFRKRVLTAQHPGSHCR